jgi:hypothetical protein
MKAIKTIFLLITSLLVFTACQTAPQPEPTGTSGVSKRIFYLPGFAEPVELSYEIVDGYAIWQGDIILGKVENGQVIDSQAIGIEGREFRWPNRTVLFKINATNFPAGSAMRATINSAIQHWRDNTDIEFVETTATTGSFVEFVSGTGCASFVGKRATPQVIILASGCGFGTVVHEIGHAVGLHHENVRYDGFEHVNVIKANVQPDKFAANFVVPPQGTFLDVGSYDFRSIMHYGCKDFGIFVDGVKQDTIVPINPPAGVSCTATGMNKIGQRVGLSPGDIAAVKLLYAQPELIYSQNTSGIADSVEAGDNMGKALATGDFNGDGRDDVAIGVPNESISGVTGAGAVHVFYGRSASTFNTATDQFWHQDVPGVQGAAETNDHFGAALAAGDFNKDGFDDLAIGIPDEDSPSTVSNSGAVIVLYGTASGLSATNNQFWGQNATGIADTSESGDRFGAALAVGDFNGNGFDDLAIGVPGEDIENTFPFPTDFDAGSVHVIYGSSSRLTSTGSQRWTQDSSGILDETEIGDQFGFSLAAGDFNGDGRDDLAVGIPFEDFGTAILDNDSGAVAVLYGSSTGVSSTDQFWTQDSSGIADETEGGDNFGFSVAAGDFNGDGRDDLAIGVPSEDLGIDIDTGLVHVIYGTTSNLSSTNSQIWTQDSSNTVNNNDTNVTAAIQDTTESGDRFGYALTAADFNNDNRDDLAIGVPGEDIAGNSDAGAVNVIFGKRSGLNASMNQLWHQGISSVPGILENGDQFGYALAAGDFNGDSFSDLIVGIPFENDGSVSDSGAVNVINNFGDHSSSPN